MSDKNDPRIPILQKAVFAEVAREREELRAEIERLRSSRDQLLAENELLWAVVDLARDYAKSGTDARLSAALAALDRPRGGRQ